MSKRRGDELLIDGGTNTPWPRNLRVKELLRVLPNLGSVRAKRKPQPDQVRLELRLRE